MARASARAPSPACNLRESVIYQLLSEEVEGGSKGVGVGLAGPDAHGFLDLVDEDLAVADLAGACSVGDGVDHLVGEVGRHGHLDLELGQEAHSIFGAAVD